jgi:hypothetical protein
MIIFGIKFRGEFKEEFCGTIIFTGIFIPVEFIKDL